MGFFNARTKKKGNGCPKADTPQVKNPETADVVIHIVDDTRTEQAAGFLRYLKPRQGAHRQCIYLSREMHGKLSRIVRTLGVNGSTIGGYIIYLTWERREDNKAEGGKEKDGGKKGMPDDVVGKSRFRMAERKPQAATMKPNAATDAQSEAVDEKDVTFADETPERHPRQVPDEELDEVFADSRVSDIGAEYDEDEEYDSEPHEAGGLTFEDIDLAMRTVKKPKATREERRHAGMVFCDMKGNELFAMIEKSSEATRRKLDELMDYYLDSVSAAQAKPAPAVMPKKAPAVPDNFEDFNIRDYV